MSEQMKRVYQAFDPAPLTSASDELYVDLEEVRGNLGVVNRLADKIRLSEKATCQLLAGHRGSGKTTELRRLQRRLEQGKEKVFGVFCEIDEDVDRNDVDFPDVLIAIVRQMAKQLRERAGIELKPGYFVDRWERAKELLGSEVDFTGVTLDAGLVKFSSTIKSSPSARLEIREFLEPDTSNWLYAANDVIGKAKLELGKKGYVDLAIVVDDLDKMVLRNHPKADCSTGEYLFVHRVAQLSAFGCHLIYTMPIALAYSAQERAIASLYGCNIPVVPMTQIKDRNGQRQKTGYAKFQQVIAKRLEEAKVAESDVFESDTVRDRLIELSGGQPRELMILIRESIVGGDLPIGPAAVERAAHEGRRAYARQLRSEHRPLIDGVRDQGTIQRTESNDALFRELLDSRAILQYINEDEWYGVNPLVPEK